MSAPPSGQIAFDYAVPSAFTTDGVRAALGLATNRARPVRFHGRLREGVYGARIALRALGRVVRSDDRWVDEETFFSNILDPVITVHPDRVFFEAFSRDQSAYGLVVLDRRQFATDGEVACGTTNVDFTAALGAAIDRMRSSRETWLRIGPEGLGVATAVGGGPARAHFEAVVPLPVPWVRGFLQMQAAAAMPGTRLTLRPVDLLAAIRYLRRNKAKVSPRALRYVFEPGRDAALVLEPFEHTIPLVGARHGYAEARSVRVWGRRRLRLLEPLLPYASEVRVYLKGRALPSFYAVALPGATFVLGLSGWSASGWGAPGWGAPGWEGGGFDLLSASTRVDEAAAERARAALAGMYAAGVSDLAEALARPEAEVDRAMALLCRRGRAIYDVEARQYRHRELFAQPIDEARYFPPDPRRALAEAWLVAGALGGVAVEAREDRKTRRFVVDGQEVERELVFRDHAVEGRVADAAGVQTPSLVVNGRGRVIFGRCGCAFFRENILNKGPCAHMLALLLASEAERGAL